MSPKPVILHPDPKLYLSNYLMKLDPNAHQATCWIQKIIKCILIPIKVLV